MNKAKKYYVDKNGNMLGYPQYKLEKIEMKPESFSAKLKIKYIGWLNSGFYLVLEDEDGKTFSMNDGMFKEYLKRNEMFLDGKWAFYCQGPAYSIGLATEDE